MGLVSWWEERKKKNIEQKINKYANRIFNLNTTHESREQIIMELCGIPGVNATRALLNRFKLTLHDNAIKDETEKEKVIKEIISRGEESIEPVKEFIRHSQEVSIPFDILGQLVDDDEFVNFTLDVLTTDEALFDDRVMEKRLDVMNVILHCKHKKIYEKVSKLINDDDDRIKIVALNILANQENIDEVRDKLLEMLVDPNTPPRLVSALIEIFSRKEWKLKGVKNKVEGMLPKEEYFINKDGIIRKRPGVNN